MECVWATVSSHKPIRAELWGGSLNIFTAQNLVRILLLPRSILFSLQSHTYLDFKEITFTNKLNIYSGAVKWTFLTFSIKSRGNSIFRTPAQSGRNAELLTLYWFGGVEEAEV